MAAYPSIRILKTTSYRGGTKTWGNRYHFSGGTPSDPTEWTTLADAVVLAEKAIHTSRATIVEAIGYLAGSDVPVFTKTYTTAGTRSATGGQACPLEVTALLRFSTAARSSKNHPVYLFNYFHDAYWDTSIGQPDTLATAEKSAIETYADSWLAGFSDGSHTLTRAGPNGATATSRTVDTYLHHRDFPR